MKVKLTQGSTLVFKNKEYKEGDTLNLGGTDLKIQLSAGIVEAVISKKEK